MNDFYYKKVPNNVIKLCKYEEYKNILNIYLYLVMNCNQNNKIITSIVNMSECLENTYDKRVIKTDNYYKDIKVLQNEIINTKTKEVLLSNIINNCERVINEYKDLEENRDIVDYNNKDLIKITLEYDNNEIKDGYTIIEFEEYEYIYNIVNDYKNKSERKLNLSTLINVYMYLKMLITLNTNLKNEIKTSVGLKNISANTNIVKKTLEKYIRILKEYKLINYSSGNYKDKQTNIYWLNTEWKKENHTEYNQNNQNNKVTDISKYLKEG